MSQADEFDEFPQQRDDHRKFTSFEGQLLMIWARSFDPAVTTVQGVRPMVLCDLVPLDGPDAGQTFAGIGIFQKVLVDRLRPTIGGRPQLGRLGKGVPTPGKNAPWVLAPVSDNDRALARKYLNDNRSNYAAPTGNTGPAYSAPTGNAGGFGDEPPF